MLANEHYGKKATRTNIYTKEIRRELILCEYFYNRKRFFFSPGKNEVNFVKSTMINVVSFARFVMSQNDGFIVVKKKMIFQKRCEAALCKDLRKRKKLLTAPHLQNIQRKNSVVQILGSFYGENAS